MTNRDAARLAFKLFGLWLMTNAAMGVAAIPCYWDSRFEDARAITLFVTLLPVLVAVGISIPVWFSADWFADRIFPLAGQDPQQRDRLRAEPLLALAMSVLGLLFVCEALPVLVNGSALFWQSRRGGSSLLGPDIEQQELIWSAAAKAAFAGGVARLLIGIGLLAGPARLASVMARLRKDLRGSLAEDELAAGSHEAADQGTAADGNRETERRS